MSPSLLFPTTFLLLMKLALSELLPSVLLLDNVLLLDGDGFLIFIFLSNIVS
jgi:hypothetical protein